MFIYLYIIKLRITNQCDDDTIGLIFCKQNFNKFFCYFLLKIIKQ